jgi:hypothetical protein
MAQHLQSQPVQAATPGRRPTGGRPAVAARRGQRSAARRPLVAGSTADRRLPDGRPLPDRRSHVPGDPRSPTAGRSAVARPDQRSATAPARVPHFVHPCPPCPTSLPTKFCTCGQLFLIGYSTYPPCPDFSLKLQTSITFDP